MRAMRLLPLVFLLATSLGHSQGTRADYDRAAKLREMTRGKVLNAKIEPHWSADGMLMWYERQIAEGKKEFVTVELATGKRTTLPERPADSAKLEEKPREDRRPRKTSPDGHWSALVRDFNLWIHDERGGGDFQIAARAMQTMAMATKCTGRPTRSAWWRCAS